MKNKWDTQIEKECAQVFSNLGWDIDQESVIELEHQRYRPDITLTYKGIVYGYVEVVGQFSFECLKRKKEQINKLIEFSKTKLFILTEGESYDIFYDGKYVATQTVPPSPEGVRAIRRLMAYYQKITEVTTENE